MGQDRASRCNEITQEFDVGVACWLASLDCHRHRNAASSIELEQRTGRSNILVAVKPHRHRSGDAMRYVAQIRSTGQLAVTVIRDECLDDRPVRSVDWSDRSCEPQDRGGRQVTQRYCCPSVDAVVGNDLADGARCRATGGNGD